MLCMGKVKIDGFRFKVMRNIIQRFQSPSYQIPYPNLVGRQHIPENLLNFLDRIWSSCSFKEHPIRAILYSDVIVLHQGMVFDIRGNIMNETRVGFLENEISEVQTKVKEFIEQGKIEVIEDTHVLCTKSGHGIFGHWLLEMLPKAHLANTKVGKFRYLIAETGSAKFDDIMAQSLEMIGINREKITFVSGERPYFLKSLIVIDGLTMHGTCMSPLVMDAIDQLSSGILPNAAEWLYVARKAMFRDFANEPEIRLALERHGYHTIAPGELPLAEAISYFKGARRVVGVMGSAMANIAFSPPGTEVINCAPANFPDTFFWFISGLRLHRYYEIRCPLKAVQEKEKNSSGDPWNGEIELSTDLLNELYKTDLTFARAIEVSGNAQVPEIDFPRIDYLKGENYFSFLRKLHKLFNPSTYLEIGTLSGGSLAQADCPSIAIDPNFRVSDPGVIGQKSHCHFYQMPSDEFFQRHNPAAILGSQIDFSFIDGMHLFEFCLRDFMNVEKYSKRNSVIAFHDCVPIDPYVAAREDDPEERRRVGSSVDCWAGDLWKVICILMEYRKDLKILSFDAEPTGLILVTNLDPLSSTLLDNYQAIISKWSAIDLKDYGIKKYIDQIDLKPTSHLFFYDDAIDPSRPESGQP